MPFDPLERRRMPRRIPAAAEPLSCVRLRTGRELSVVDASDAGLLVEGTARLLPGTHLDVHVVTRDGRVLVRSRVVRAYVSALAADVVRYRGAFAFERVVDTTAVGYGVPSAMQGAAGAPGNRYPVDESASHTLREERIPA